MAASNKSVVDKADIAVANLISDGGYLAVEQADAFIQNVQDQPTILNEARVVTMANPTMEINKIGFGSRVLKVAPASGTALAASDRSAPTTSKVTLNSNELIAEILIPYDVLEDNIERGGLEDTIFDILSERVARDVEELIILGDTASSDTFLAVLDGLLEQSTSHVVDYSLTPVSTIDVQPFKAGLKALPNKYQRDPDALRFFVSPDVQTEYAYQLGTRATMLGDARTTDAYNNMLRAMGVPLRKAALMPDTKYLLTYPQNIIVGFHRKIMIESDRDIRARVLIIVLTLRVDVKFEEEDSVVKCVGLAPNGETTTTA